MTLFTVICCKAVLPLILIKLDRIKTVKRDIFKPFIKTLRLTFQFFSWLTSGARLGSEGQLSEFIEGLGPGQLVGRQVLASPALGDIQLSMCDKRGNLEVEVIRARGLQCKPGSKTLPGMSFPLRIGIFLLQCEYKSQNLVGSSVIFTR